MIIVRNNSSRYTPNKRIVVVTLPDKPCPDEFVSLDVETATTQGDICQIGMVLFRNEEIIEEQQFLIRPPEDKYDFYCSKIHGIFSATTEKEPYFPEYWPKIKSFLEGRIVVCHNAGFDLSALTKTMDKYDLGDIEIEQSIDTCLELGQCPLYSACVFFGVPLEKHHDALEDAVACGRLLIEYSKRIGETVSIPVVSEVRNVKPIAPVTRSQDTVFSGKSVVISGIFENWPERNDLAVKLLGMGALVKSSVSKKTDYLIKGEFAGSTKTARAEELIEQGFPIKVICEEELIRLLGEESR